MRRFFVGFSGGEPILDNLQEVRRAGHFVVLPDAIEADSMRPFPAMPGLGVDDAAIGEGEEELTGFVLDVDEVGDEKVNFGSDSGRRCRSHDERWGVEWYY